MMVVTACATSKITRQSPYSNLPLKRGLRLPYSADGAPADGGGRGNRRRYHYFENGQLHYPLGPVSTSTR